MIIKRRVLYADTDHFGVVYYARYFEWFEAGRTEILREHNIMYSVLEKKGIFAPVVDAHISYKKPIHYDEEVEIKTSITHIGNSSIKFEYEVIRSGELCATGYTVNVFIDKDMNKVSVPEKIRSAFR